MQHCFVYRGQDCIRTRAESSYALLLAIAMYITLGYIHPCMVFEGSQVCKLFLCVKLHIIILAFAFG